MKKVIDITAKRKAKADPELQEMMRFSDGIDSLVTEQLELGVVEQRNLLAVMSHRLGSFLALMTCPDEDKEMLINHSIELILKLSLKSTH